MRLQNGTSNETYWILYSLRSYLGWQLEASGNELASWIHSRSFRVSWNDNLLRRLPSKEVSLMGLEVIAVLVFALFMEVDQFIRENVGLLFFSSIFLILWLSGIITIVRRWAGQ